MKKKVLGTLLLTVTSAGLGLPSAFAHRKAKPIDPEVTRALLETAQEFNLNYNKFRTVAKCESGLDATNSPGGYWGLFQHDKRYWLGRVRDFNRVHPHYPVGEDPHNPFWNARIAGWMIKNGGYGPWPNCGK